MNKKTVMPGFFAVAFVWFTTHFGGGFASGRQLVAYYVNYGWYATFMPIVATLLEAFVFYYAWKYAVQHKTYDYRSWAKGIYKPIEGIFANLFEIIFNLILVTATAVAFATGGATIEGIFGTPYVINTIVIAIAIFLLTIFGADVVRKAASTIAIAIIIGILLIYIPNIIHFSSKIAHNVSGLKSGALPNPHGFWSALWQAIIYAGFQACCLGAYVAHADVLKDVKETKKAAFWGFIVNVAILMVATFGIIAHYEDGILSEAVPALFVVKNGIGSSFMTPLVSILIILGVISTGVNLIYGITSRLVKWLGRKDNLEIVKEKERSRSIFVSACYVVLTWCIALFGLIPLIAKGYGTLGYVSIFVIMIPILFKGIVGWDKKGDKVAAK